MDRYGIAVVLFCAVINGTLLMGVGKMCGRSPALVRLLASSLLVGIYAGICWGNGVPWINRIICRIPILAIVGWLTFGRSVMCIGVYTLLSLGVEEIVFLTDNSNGLFVVILIVLVLYLSMRVFSGTTIGPFVPVELQFAGKRMRLTALRDTGNMLRDPITGTPVLILGLRASKELTGLDQRQLQQPVEVMRQPPIPGLRLIPYKTISESNGFILGVRINAVRIGDWKGCLVVAFAPEEFGVKGEFDALMGGTI